MAEFTYEQLTDLKDTPVEELTELNKRLGEDNKSYLSNYENLRRALVICADSRVPEDALNDGSFMVIANAGNVFDPDYNLPAGIEEFFVVGHEKEYGSGEGCGAVEAARMPAEELEKLKSEDPDLYRVVTTAKPEIRENIDATVQALQEKGFTVGKGMYDHTKGTVHDLEGPEDMIEAILNANEKYRELIHNKFIEKNGEDGIKNGQDPKYVVLNLNGPSLGKYLEEGSNVPNFIFEVVQPGDHVEEGKMISENSKGGQNYGLDHFKRDDNVGLVIARSTSDLERALKDQTENKIFEKYMDKGKTIYGVVPNKETHELTFYKINKK